MICVVFLPNLSTQDHIDEFYAPFCKSAIRAFFTYGFVPWRLRKISKGDMVPEVIPPGLFEWHTELGPTITNGAPVRPVVFRSQSTPSAN